jgi:hypothetical protein
MWEHEPDILIRLLKENSINLIKGKDLVLGTKDTVSSEYYGDYTIRLIGVELPYLFKTEKRFWCYWDKFNETFPARKMCPLIVKSDLSDFPCLSIWMAIREDNKAWSYKDTEYEVACKDTKPSKYLPFSSPEKRLARFLEKWPELVLGIDKYNEALKFFREEDF